MNADQLTLGGVTDAPARRKLPKSAPAKGVAAVDPVARVMVDLPLPHLDRAFDFAVPEALADAAVVGARVRVRFAGRLVNGFVLERRTDSDHEGALRPLQSVIGSVPPLTVETAALCRAVADRYAGTFADVVRFAVPARHARGEAGAAKTDPARTPAPPAQEPPNPSALNDYLGGPALLQRIRNRSAQTRAALTLAPGDDRWKVVADLVLAADAADAGAVVLVPDGRDVTNLGAELARRGVTHVELTADLGPEARYRRFVQIRTGAARIVVGTRTAAFAPVADLGLLLIWDDGSPDHAERQAPGWHAREVLALRAAASGVALVAAGTSRTPEVMRWVQTRWAVPVERERTDVRDRAPRVIAIDESGRNPDEWLGHLPSRVVVELRRALPLGPALIQVPRTGYLPAVSCRRCHTAAVCAECGGRLLLEARNAAPTCGTCSAAQPAWVCAACGDSRLRSIAIGAMRVAEELGRMFPGVPVLFSAAGHMVDIAPDHAALVVATPGAEPLGLYSAAVLMDADAPLFRETLRAQEDARRRWFDASALVRPGHDGGVVVLLADASLPSVQAVIRWDPVGAAERELAERQDAALPPARRLVLIDGPAAELRAIDAATAWPASAFRYPVDAQRDPARLIVTCSVAEGALLSSAVKTQLVRRSAAGLPAVSVRIDPALRL